jgi:hypothetical protein
MDTWTLLDVLGGWVFLGLAAAIIFGMIVRACRRDKYEK